MRSNRVKRALADGGIALGTMVFEFDTPGIGRIVANSGADFVMFDMEHTGWSTETLKSLFAACGGTTLVPMARVPAAQYHLIARTLDVGAMGIMVPMVESEEQARQIAQSAKYPPVGRRGAAFGVAHDDYTSGDVVEKIRTANAEGVLIAQIETVAGLEQVEGIAAVEGIDVLWIGHFDLTNSLGIPADFEHPSYLAAVERVLRACRQHHKAAGFMVASPEEAVAKLAQGFRCLAYWGDLWIYQQALSSAMHRIRAEAAAAQPN
ncbi:MAG: aldolase/citrate lyase family protein [Chloroflexota bacterium]|nr:aldolase/citrate lyase family protein [Chloroflexota bacterium]